MGCYWERVAANNKRFVYTPNNLAAKAPWKDRATQEQEHFSTNFARGFWVRAFRKHVLHFWVQWGNYIFLKGWSELTTIAMFQKMPFVLVCSNQYFKWFFGIYTLWKTIPRIERKFLLGFHDPIWQAYFSGGWLNHPLEMDGCLVKPSIFN